MVGTVRPLVPVASAAEVTKMGNADSDPVAQQVTSLRVVQLRSVLYRLDYLRGLLALGRVLPVPEIAERLWTSQDKVQQALTTAAQVDAVVPGFSGASPYEVAQRYAAGLLTRDQLIDELSRWRYRPQDRTDGWDDLVLTVPGSFDDVITAARHGLIDDEAYDAVLDAGSQGGAPE
jgi:hypothetical protein